jgi:hypothetical protein
MEETGTHVADHLIIEDLDILTEEVSDIDYKCIPIYINTHI